MIALPLVLIALYITAIILAIIFIVYSIRRHLALKQELNSLLKELIIVLDKRE